MSDSPVAYRLTGQVSFENLAAIRGEGEAAIARGGEHVVVDLSGLEHGNSATVALLMAWYRAAGHQDKTIEFVQPPVELENIVELSGLTEILPLRESHGAAAELNATRVQADA